MRIELRRKLVATDYSICNCVICGNDFDHGNVFAWASGDKGEEMGELCPFCLDYLNRRKGEAEDPGVNWPASGWPTPRDLEEATERYPEPMFATEADWHAAAFGRVENAKIRRASVVWRMKREDENCRLVVE